uniref:Glycosyl hydrolase family 31 C-terminal domain-containing protein n=1 Tax=Strombidium rassoulzadegani TaxID=1082188 RepID=A0A7S3CN65_9SPIT|mmetsp:Transcript_17775/g.30103  ORF Transcript_17775/g.30103 Transcript_17775/m.30103 type:complete len:170 (+) Transcript_17775:1866-2375(+)
MNTFSDMVMRTHPGLQPSKMYQVYDSDDISQFFARFVHIHSKILKDYKLQLMKDLQEDGVPPTRSLLLEFPEDQVARGIVDQFMLGSQILMAPILEEGQTRRDVYLPSGMWRSFFSREILGGQNGGVWLKDQEAPIGTPLVFVRLDHHSSSESPIDWAKLDAILQNQMN